MLQQLLFLLTLVPLISAKGKCNETNPYQHSCYTITKYPEVKFFNNNIFNKDPKDIYGISAALHVKPSKLAQYNQVDIRHTFLVGEAIRVPLDQCTPQPGQWGCYTVQQGDSLHSIAFTSSASMVRNTNMLIEWNEEILYGDNQIYAGMQLRMPVLPQVVTWTTTYYTVSNDYQDIEYIAEYSGTTVDHLLELNENILQGNSTLNKGMDLKVPKPAEQVTPPSPCVENNYWNCFTAQANDSLWTASQKYLINNQLICDVNGLADCELIQIGQTIAVPKNMQTKYSDCVDKPGVWECTSLKYISYLGSTPTSPQSLLQQYYGFSQGFYDEDLSNLILEYNQDRITNKNISIYANQTYRVPYQRCTPNINYTCLAQGSENIKWFFGSEAQSGDYWSGMGQYEFHNQGWFPGCSLEGAKQYNCLKVPRQTYTSKYCPSYYNIVHGCEDALNCPECVNTPGENTCYKVGHGESIYSIAQQFDLDWQYLCQYNGMLNNCSCLNTEDVFVSIPSDWTVPELSFE